MAALFNDAALIHRHHAVGMFDGRQTVCDHQRRAAFHQHVERVLHRALALAVQRRCGLVEDQHRGVLVDGSRDGQALALAAGELACVVAEHSVQALRQSQCKFEQVRALQGGAHALAVDGLAEGDVG